MAMKNPLLILPLLVACSVLVFAACTRTVQRQIEKRTLSDSESARQIQLLGSIAPNDIEGKMVSDFPELFSVADEICFENGKIVRYFFHRKGAGGNDDGSDSTAVIEVSDETIKGYYMLVVLS
ncbi:MAG: hypothetical protein U0930_26240 [Pirellulales bacterium]